jgi:hypothetical protein
MPPLASPWLCPHLHLMPHSLHLLPFEFRHACAHKEVLGEPGRYTESCAVRRQHGRPRHRVSTILSIKHHKRQCNWLWARGGRTRFCSRLAQSVYGPEVAVIGSGGPRVHGSNSIRCKTLLAFEEQKEGKREGKGREGSSYSGEWKRTPWGRSASCSASSSPLPPRPSC